MSLSLKENTRRATLVNIPLDKYMSMPRHKKSTLYRYHTNKASGICVQCGKVPNMAGFSKCKECHLYIKGVKVQIRQNHKDSGLCVECGKSRGADGAATLCRHCVDLQLAYDKRREQSHIASGLCIRCSKQRVGTSRYCELDLLKQFAHRHLKSKKLVSLLKDKLSSQNYKCFYSGIDLKIGENASIDHIKPQSRHIELKHNINNLVWCDLRINEMKRALSVNEFVSMCKLVVNTMEPTCLLKIG